MKKTLSFFLSAFVLTSCGVTSVSPSVSVPTPEKECSVLVCFSGDGEEGKSLKIKESFRERNKTSSISYERLPLGTNGSNYASLVESKVLSADYAKVLVIGQKTGFYLQDTFQHLQGIDFVTIDAETIYSYSNVRSYDFIPEEIGYLASGLRKENKVGYFSSYDDQNDKKRLFGFLQKQKEISVSKHVYVHHIEETSNYEKTVAYYNDLKEKGVQALFESIGDNYDFLPEEEKRKVISVSSSDFLYKDREAVYDRVEKDILSQKVKNTELSYKDGYLKFKDGHQETLSYLPYDEGQFKQLSEELIVDSSNDYGPKYSVDIPYHEGIPECSETNNWKHAPRYGADHGRKPSGWTAIGAWATIYSQEGFRRAENTGIEFKNRRIWGYTEQTGWKLIEWANPVGSFYDKDFKNDYHKDFPLCFRNNPSNKTTQIKLDGTNKGFNYHPFSSQNDLIPAGLENLTYVISTMDIRLIVWDKNKESDIDNAKYVANIGADYWSKKGAVWQPDWSTNRDVCVGQFRTITKKWKTLYRTNIPVDQYDSVVKDGKFLSEFE